MVCPYAWNRYGGVQSHVASLSAVLRDRGHEVRVLAPLAPGGLRAGAEGEVAFVGRALPVPANGSIAPLSFGPGAAAGVRRALQAFAPDVLHLHEPLIPSLSLLSLIGAAVPVVGTFHAASESSFGYRAARPILRHAAARLTVRTAVSDAARALVGRYFPGEYLLTPNGVDVESYRIAPPLRRGVRKTVLFLGRLERRKGLEVLIQAMARLRDLEVELAVVGAGPGQAAARRLARTLDVEVTFHGAVEDAAKKRAFASADVYCAPALGGESFGIVLLEAMAAGAPVVCSDLPGFREVASDAATLVPPGRPGPLADGLRAVLADPALAEARRKAGARRASMFDWRRLAAGVEAIYDRAFAGASH